MEPSPVRVAVIGAGPAGLCVARHLLAKGDRFRVQVFEMTGDIGGTWRYTDSVDFDCYGIPVHSSMYKNLRSNLPKEVMTFLDMDYPDYDGRSFLHHTEVLKYLEDYASKFSLCNVIQLHTQVVEVRPQKTQKQTLWEVRTRNSKTEENSLYQVDAIIVCNGRFSHPNVPQIPGLKEFQGSLIHSHHYRTNEPFRGQTVVVLGARFSGVDISIEISSVARQVILSHNLSERFHDPLPSNMCQETGIGSICGKTVNFTSGHSCSVDAIVLCTGYLFHYPFLHQECQVTVHNQQVHPLYKQMFHSVFPNMIFVGLVYGTVTFRTINQQALLSVKYLEGAVTLPDTQNMQEDTRQDMEDRKALGIPEHYYHFMQGAKLRWDYDDQLSQMGGFSPVPASIRKLFDHMTMILRHITQFRHIKFRLIEEDDFHQEGVTRAVVNI